MKFVLFLFVGVHLVRTQNSPSKPEADKLSLLGGSGSTVISIMPGPLNYVLLGCV